MNKERAYKITKVVLVIIYLSVAFMNFYGAFIKLQEIQPEIPSKLIYSSPSTNGRLDEVVATGNSLIDSYDTTTRHLNDQIDRFNETIKWINLLSGITCVLAALSLYFL